MKIKFLIFLFLLNFNLRANFKLIEASYYGKTQEVKNLIKNKVDVNFQNNNGFSALMVASACGHENIVKILLENKANQDLRNKNGDTALILALEYGHPHIIKALKSRPNNSFIENAQEHIGNLSDLFSSVMESLH